MPVAIIVVPCQFVHPSKLLYAGHSPGHVVEITGYNPAIKSKTLAGQIRLAFGQTSLHRQVVMLRVLVPAGQRIPEDHRAVMVRAVKKRSNYSGRQVVLCQRCTETRRSTPEVVKPGSCYPWETAWQTKVPARAIKREK